MRLKKANKNIHSTFSKKFSLLISGEFKFTEIIEKYVNLLEVGAIIVVFSSYLEKLHEVSEQLSGLGLFSKIDMMDSFLRFY